MNKPNLDLLNRGSAGSPPDAFNISYDVIQLPSKGLLYSEDHPLCGETELEFRAMTAIQENILASRALIKKGTVLPMLIKSCLANPSIDPGTLLLGDKAAILMAIRISGFGPDYRVQTACPNCGHVFPHTFNLSQCQLKMLDVDPVAPHNNLFEYVMPSDGKTTIRFRLLVDNDDLEIMQMQQAKKKALSKNGVQSAALDVDTRLTDEMIRMIVAVNGTTDREYISEFVKRMRVMDSRAFRKYVSDIQPGIDWEQGVNCSNCGETDVHKIVLSTEFFWPKMASD